MNIKQNDIEELVLFDGIKTIGEKAKEFWQKGVTIKIKSSHHDIITEADVELEKDLKNLITDKFPQAKMLGEESGGEIGRDYWTIDPIDGSSSFAAGLPTWCIAVGRVENNEFTFSIIYVPIGIDGPELYYAKKGKGAFMNGKKLSVSHKANIKDANLYLRAREIREDKDGTVRSLITKTRMLWIPGSTSLALAYLSAGKLDIVLSKNQSVWDSPGTLLVTEAGGTVTFLDHKNPVQKSPYLHSILATNGPLHELVSSHLKI